MSTRLKQMRTNSIRACILYVLLFAWYLPPADAQRPTTKAAKTPPSPFESFRALDDNLARLDGQLKQLEVLIARSATGARATSSGRKGRQPWATASRPMLSTIGSTQRTTLTLQRRYRKSRAGREMLANLARESNGLVRSARSLNRAATPAEAQTSLALIRDARIKFALSFQAIAADYAALRCVRGEWSCCELVAKEGQKACHWTCKPAPRQCGAGLLGSRSQSASAEVIKH
jgi:hypothetical protein